MTTTRSTRPGWALLLLCLAQLTLLLDFSIVNMALPAIEEAAGFSPVGLQWMVSAYALSFGGMLLLGGRMADLLGRRRIFITGLVIFGLGSLLAGLVTEPATLIAARIIQGVGGGMVAPAALSLVTTMFAEGPERNRAIGWFSAASASGFALGVLTGGALTSAFGWRSVFFINIPIVAAASVFALRLLPGTRPTSSTGRYDVPGAVTVTVGMTAVIYALSAAPMRGLAAPRVLVALALGIVMLAAFVVVELRTADPLVRFGIFRQRSLAVANALSLVVPGIMGAVVLLLSLYLQHTMGKEPLIAGLSFLPLGLTVIVAAPLSAVLATRFGVKPILVVGIVVVAAALLLLRRITPTSGYADVMLPSLIVIGIGFGAFFATATVAGTANVADAEQGLASALINTAQQVGTAVGVALLASLAEHHTAGLGARSADSVTAGLRYALLVAAVTALCAAVLAAVALPRRSSTTVPPGQSGPPVPSNQE
jgi:EmrB/QacA subfamily drug resistance transporter